MTESRIGILGGTFDPVHIGHLIIAEEVRQKLKLKEVIFIPTGQPWLKKVQKISSAEHRLQMTILATASNPYFSVSTIEIERDGPTYSIETISELKAGLGAGVVLYFIVGFDALAELPSWKDARRLVEICRVVGVARPPHTKLNLRSLESAIPRASERIITVDVPHIGVSATEIRKRVADGYSVKYLVPESVEQYIRENGLYSEGG